MRNFKLTLCYDGGRYDGWQRQGNSDNTIQGKLEVLLTRLLSQSVEVAGSGRTDAGVHALGQVCSFRAETELTCAELLREIRRYLPEDIGALSLEEAETRFHARLSCREKTYVYRIWNSEEPNVFERRWMVSVPGSLDLDAMRTAAAQLVGEHDFTTFCANRHMKKTAVRNLKRIDIARSGGEIRISLTGDGFCTTWCASSSARCWRWARESGRPRRSPPRSRPATEWRQDPRRPRRGLRCGR